MSDFMDGLATVGRALGAAGVFVGRKVAEGYRAIDPDVHRHVVQTPLLVYSLFGARQAPVEALPDDGHPPLVFVHGLGGSRGDFMMMAGYFSWLGRKRSYRVHFEEARTLAERAAELNTFVREIARVNGAPQVDIVAHSLGGVSARLALTDHDLAPLVRTLVTLGSPHQGSYPARYGNTPIFHDLRPDSELMRRLAATPWPETVRGVSFWSRNDLFVLPAESAIADGTEAIEATPATHYAYLLFPKHWDAVADALGIA